MSSSDWIATIGVTILLIGFALNLVKIITADSYLYLSFNFLGSFLAGIAAVMIHLVPFIVLEAVWAMVSLFALIKKVMDTTKKTNE
jgi:hypothetical protein